MAATAAQAAIRGTYRGTAVVVTVVVAALAVPIFVAALAVIVVATPVVALAVLGQFGARNSRCPLPKLPV